MPASESRSTAAARRMRQEEQLLRRRNAEHDREVMWKEVKTYFNNWEVNTMKVNTWTSPAYYDSITESRTKIEEAETKKLRLDERRKKLSALLMAENEQYEAELSLLHRKSSNSVANEKRADELKLFMSEMRMREDETRSKEAEIQLYNQWKSREPILRDFARRQETQFVRNAWVDQVMEKREQMKLREEREMEEEKLREQERQVKEREEAEVEERRKQRERELQEELMAQIQELRAKELLAETLKKEEALSLRKQAQLEEIILQRTCVEKKREMCEQVCFLMRQYQLKLRRKARQVQEELAEDQKTLAELLRNEEEERNDLDEAKQRTLRDIIEMRNELEAQRQLEKQLEDNVQFVFHEEARRMWTKQEARWRAESDTRKELLKSVMTTLKQQVQEKITRNLNAQRELLDERSLLLGRVEEANGRLNEEKATRVRCEEERRRELDAASEENAHTRLEALKRKEIETHEKILEEKRNEIKLLQEMKKMNLSGYKPSDVARRRIIW